MANTSPRGNYRGHLRSGVNVVTYPKFQEGRLVVHPDLFDERAFKELAKDSSFIDRGMSIDFDMLLAMLNGDETMILNPDSNKSWFVTAR